MAGFGSAAPLRTGASSPAAAEAPVLLFHACHGQMALGQLHWSTANYQPFQERALWDGLVAMYGEV